MTSAPERERPSRPPPPTTITDDKVVAIQKYHDEAYLYIQHGLSCDEQGQGEQALTLYTKGLRCIDRAMDIDCNSPNCVGAHWDSGRKNIQKMKKTKLEIQSRVEHLIQCDPHAARSLDDPPPSYEDATTPTRSTDPFDFVLVEDGDVENGATSNLSTNATELFSIRDGVQIFFITPEGYVSAPSYPSGLGIYKLHGQVPQGASNVETPPAFLKVGDWTYPLVPGSSPVLQANWGAYIFPDVTNPDPGKFYQLWQLSINMIMMIKNAHSIFKYIFNFFSSN